MLLFAKAGPIIWPLLVCSVVAVAVIIERTWFWIRENRKRDPQQAHRILHLVERGLFEEASKVAYTDKDAILRIFHNGLSHRHFSLEYALEVAGNTELKRMRRYLGVLDTIITIAPLLGIFGTVTGILVAFQSLEGQIPDPQIVAGGIAQAVITTVAGLAIAIPTVIAYNIFSAKVDDASSHLSEHITNFLILYRKGTHRAEKPGPDLGSDLKPDPKLDNVLGVC